jgi:hypothetical protein
MNLDEAKRIWPGVSDHDLKEWLDLKNKIKPELHGDVPKGATIEIDEETGEAVPRSLFKPDSIIGQVWKEHWAQNELGSKEPEEIQKEYEKFCRHYRINVPCWEPIGPYPVPS